MSKEIDLLKSKIKQLKLKKKELLAELDILSSKIAEKRKWDDLRKIEALRKQIVDNS
jgi:hypothetical protein